MTGTNPFEDNPWTGNSGGPRFGNAYEDDSGKHETYPNMTMSPEPGSAYQSTSGPPLPPRSPAQAVRMPSPSDYRTTTTTATSTTVWNESNKTEYHPPEVTQPQDAYQYSGTRFGNQEFSTANAYSSSPQPTPSPKPEAAAVQAALPPVYQGHKNPSKLRVLLRVLQLITSVGSLGFAAGASPVRKRGQNET
ncbi:hypothetical protein EC973_000962 [Apophysomyces ossiformis]|uniref:Uncharacterized protein n=1 Tax=Apophysomyces ossiformis TaxID=679940 RepID=A0A8H7BQL3_9FUNG|nr:hypothetical protein EC973_000962 [Apophysomyces ossiformis]